MSYCVKCERSFQGERCPLCGGPPKLSSEEIDKSLSPYVAVWIAGLAVFFFAKSYFGLVDINPPWIAACVIFALPLLISLISGGRKWTARRVGIAKGVFIMFGVLAIALPVLLVLNEALDRSPPRQVDAIVTSKLISSGRGSTYSLVVAPSWRPGRAQEKLIVSEGTFSSVHQDEAVSITVHNGLFGISWYSSIAPR